MAIGSSVSSNMNHTFIFNARLKLLSKSFRIFIHYREIVIYLQRTYESIISTIDYIDKEDLDLVNHLSGKTQKYLKLSFKNIQDLISVRSELQKIVEQNQKNKET